MSRPYAPRPEKEPTAPVLPAGERIGLLRDMIRVRRFEEACAEMYAKGRIRGFLHLGVGQEACAVGTLRALGPHDAIVAHYREHAHALLRGMPMRTALAEMFGFSEGCSMGRGGSMHLFDRDLRLFGGNAIVAGGMPTAVGVALADVLRGDRNVTACFFGDGAAAEGAFHESLNLAALWHLPVLFICENNGYAMGTAVERALAETGIARLAERYGITTMALDGMDVEIVGAATEQAVAQVRSRGDPVLLELLTYRFRAHSMYDPQRYRTQEEVDAHRSRDPLALQAARLTEAGLVDHAAVARIEREASEEVAGAIEAAGRGTLEPVGDLLRFVCAEDPPR